MPYDQPCTSAEQPGPPGNMADWHPDPVANQQLQHMSQYQLPPEVWDSLIKQATAPDPSMPQPGPERPLSMWEATAAALHPQLLSQFKRDPMAAPQFQGQMAAFQQAMQNKRSAMANLTTLGSRDIAGQYSLLRPGAAGKPQIRIVAGPDGAPALQEFLPNGQGGFEAGKILATGPETLKMLQGQSGYEAVGSHTGKPLGQPIVPPGGMPVPPGVATTVAGDVTGFQALGDLGKAYDTIREKTQGQTPIGQYLRQVGSEKFRLASAYLPEYADYIAARRRALNAYVKSITGAQFSEAELTRYEKQYPEAWDSPEVAKNKIQLLQQSVVRDMKAKMAIYPGAANMVPDAMKSPQPAGLDGEFDAYLKAKGQ